MKKHCLCIFLVLFTCLLRAQQLPDTAFCGTPTFRSSYTNPIINKQRAYDILQLSNSNYIVAGYDISASGMGRLTKLNSQGDALQYKIFAVGTSLEILKIREFSNGKLYALGLQSHPGPYTKIPIILAIDSSNLDILSVHQLNPNTGVGPTVWWGVDIAEGQNNSLFVYSYNDSLVNVTKLNTSGLSAIWSKTYRPGNKPLGIALGVEENYVYVCWNEIESGFSNGAIMTLDATTGNYFYGSRVGGAADGFNIEFQSMMMTNLRPRIIGLQWKNNQYQSIRINFSPTLTLEGKEIFDITGLNPVKGTIVRQNQISEIIAQQHDENSRDIYLTSAYPDNYQHPIRSWKLPFTYPVKLVSVIRSNDGGIVVLTEDPGMYLKVTVTKTDSAANLPVCGSSLVTSGFNRVAQPNENYILPSSAIVLQPSIATMPFPPQNRSLTSDIECRQQNCPAVPEPDSCLGTFFKEYRNYTNSIVTDGLIKLDNGNLLMYGRGRQSPYNAALQDEVVTILDTAGRLIDRRSLIGPEGSSIRHLMKLRDGRILGTGSVNNGFNNIDHFLIKFDQQFNIIWQKKIITTPKFNGIIKIIESSEGDFYCYLTDVSSSLTEKRTIMKLDGIGNPVWTKQYPVGSNAFMGSGEFIPALVEVGTSIIIKYNQESGDFSPFLMSISKVDGTVLWVKKYQMNGPYTGSGVFALTSLTSDGNKIFMSGTSNDRRVFLRIDKNGNVELAKRTPDYSISFGTLNVKNDGKILVGVVKTIYPASINGVVEMDADFNTLRTQFMQIPRDGSNTAIVDYNDSITYAAGNLWSTNLYWASVYLQKYNFKRSFASCEVTEFPIEMETYTQVSVSANVTAETLSSTGINSYGAVFQNYHIAYNGFYCGNLSTCNSIDLNGPAIICDSSQIYDFPVVRNSGCNGKVVWDFDTLDKQIRIISITDTLLRIKISKSGAFKLYAKVFANCTWLEDSITVQGTATSSNILELGADTTICQGNSIKLQAGSGFSSYLWQDGTTDSVLIAKTPGLYHVQVTSCGNIMKDSIRILASPSIPFSAGPDRIKCYNDTVHLAATPGFMNYLWSNNYNINSLNAATVVVNPLVDTFYYVRAERSPGCFAYDTVSVSVIQSAFINLGNDTSFCTGNSIMLNAGNGFSDYLWSDGSTNQQLQVKTSGIFSVIATGAMGCKSYDTIKVLDVWPLPLVTLDKSPELCAGSSKILDPGVFNSYLWNNGSTDRTLVVSGIGKYYVEVRDANNCAGSDTSRINIITPLPSAFLPVDTAICSYNTITISATSNYNRYNWSTGGISSSIVIDKPGLYWLDVTDHKNCKGRDSIIVNPKQCMTGVYVPNAFTPTHDRKNDVFRPLISGNVKLINFTVYDRWGQVVFQSKDALKGWNGEINGKQMPIGIYVWQCHYEMEGKKQMQKGTVLLVR